MRSPAITRLLAASLIAALAACGGAPEHHDHDSQPHTASQPVAGVSVLNTHCPVHSEHAVDPDVTTSYGGKTIGFCCGGCKSAWEGEMTDAEKMAFVQELGGN